jgi:GT2 family glycosyltransferase
MNTEADIPAISTDPLLRASIVIPTFNRCDVLLQTLTSLVDQSVPPDRYEVIVTVDGATDGTTQALQGLQFRHALRWTCLETNQGIAAARNAAARLARHEVLIFLDDDQIASRDLVAVHLDLHQRNDAILVQGYYPLAPGYDRHGGSLIYQRSMLASLAHFPQLPPLSWHIWGGHISVRRETWQRVGGFDETFRVYGGEDTDFGMRVAALGIPFVFEPRALSHHLHRVSYAALRRQAFSQGRVLRRLAHKHGQPIEAFSGGAVRGPFDRAFRTAWRVNPQMTDLLGRALVPGLWFADQIRYRPAQIALARLMHRLYKVGGLTAS